MLAQDNGGAPVALTPIAAREPLLPSKLSGPGARASVAAEIADGMRAYTIKVTDVTGVGGHALPGDRVDVVLMRDLTPEGHTRNYVSEVVIQNVRVLGVDLNADLASNKPATPNTATLEVSVRGRPEAGRGRRPRQAVAGAAQDRRGRDGADRADAHRQLPVRRRPRGGPARPRAPASDRLRRPAADHDHRRRRAHGKGGGGRAGAGRARPAPRQPRRATDLRARPVSAADTPAGK